MAWDDGEEFNFCHFNRLYWILFYFLTLHLLKKRHIFLQSKALHLTESWRFLGIFRYSVNIHISLVVPQMSLPPGSSKLGSSSNIAPSGCFPFCFVPGGYFFEPLLNPGQSFVVMEHWHSEKLGILFLWMSHLLDLSASSFWGHCFSTSFKRRYI